MRRLLAKIKGIQKSPHYQYNPFLQNLESNFIPEYEKLLKFEEDFWKEKSRINWLLQGDSNTKFFHASTLNKRRRNRILALKNESGNWIEDQDEVFRHITDFFSNMYTTNHLSYPNHHYYPPHNNHQNTTLSASKVALLDAPLRDFVIINAIKSFKPPKAPGPDGIQPIFF